MFQSPNEVDSIRRLNYFMPKIQLFVHIVLSDVRNSKETMDIHIFPHVPEHIPGNQRIINGSQIATKPTIKHINMELIIQLS